MLNFDWRLRLFWRLILKSWSLEMLIEDLEILELEMIIRDLRLHLVSRCFTLFHASTEFIARFRRLLRFA